MPTKFQIKRTSVASRTPNTTNSGNAGFIAAGELAINLTDQKVFSSNGTLSFEVGANLTSLTVNSAITIGNSTVNTTVNSSSIVVTKIFANGATGSAGQVLSANSSGGIYWETSAAGGALAVTSDTFNGNSSNTIFILSVSSTTDRSFVYLNGVQQAPTTDYAISGSTLTFVAAPATNNVIEVRSFDIPTIADITITSDTFTANGTQTTFTLSTSDSSVTNSLVFLNGVTQVPTTDYTLSSTTLTFLSAPADSTAVQAISFTSAGVKSTAFTGNGSNTQFTLPVTSTTSKTIVAINGVTQTPVTDYSVSGTTLIFAAAPANNDNILVRVLQSKVDSAGSNTQIQYNKSGSLGGSAGLTFNDTTNNVVVGNTLTVPNFILNASNPPANSTATGSTGTFAWDSTFFYVATGTNTWKKVPITTDGSIAIGSNVTVNTSAIFIGNSTVNTTITAGNVHLQGTQLTVGNVVVNGNQLVVGNVTITDTQITVGNSTVNTVIGQTGSLSGNGALLTSVNASSISSGTLNTARLPATVNVSTTINVGANVNITTSSITVGNSTVNTAITPTSLDVDGIINVGNTTITGDLVVSGNVFFNGATTNVNSTNLLVEDKNIILGDVTTPSDVTADGGGITLKGGTDKTLNWIDTTDAWTSSEEFNLVSGKSYRINGTAVVNSTSLGTGITGSSLTSVGTLTTLAAGNTTITGFANVTSSIQGGGTLTIAGALSGVTTLAAGNTTITGFANVTSTIQGGAGLIVAGAVSGITTLAAGNTTITGFANVSTTLQVTGTSSLNSTTNIAGALAVSNTVTACTTSVDAVSVYRGLDVGTVGAAGVYLNMGALSGATQTVGARLVGVLAANATHGYATIDTRVAGSLVTQLTINNGVTTVNGSLSVSTNTATFGTALYVVANGNVGIGTSAPFGKLSVLSTTGAGSTVTAWSAGHSIFGPNVGSGTGAALGLAYNTTDDRSEILSLAPNVAWKPLYLYSAGLQIFAQTATFSAIFAANGNVGIGNTAPTQKLQVSGNVVISGLTSVASVAEWCTGGYALNTAVLTFDITVQNDSGQGVPHHVQAAHTHYNFNDYGCVLDTWIATRSTTIIQQNNLLSISSVGGGAWTATKTSDTNLRVSKSAGTYGGAGWYWIKVTTFSTI